MALPALLGAGLKIGGALLAGGDKKKDQSTGQQMAQKMLPGSTKEKPKKLGSGRGGSIVVASPSVATAKTPIKEVKVSVVSDIPSLDASMQNVYKSMMALQTILAQQAMFKRTEALKKQQRRKKLARDLKEKGLEAGTGFLGAIGFVSNVINKMGFFQRMKKFFVNMILGSITLWLLENYPKIEKFFVETYEKLKETYETLKTYFIDPLWNIGKTIVGPIWNIGQEIMKYTGMDKKIDELKQALVDLGKDADDLDDEMGQPRTGLGPTPPSQVSPIGGGGGVEALFSVISKAEGGVNSVNRGEAGDTPGGAMSVLGKNLTDMTVDEVHGQQYGYGGDLFAVGKYQIIPQTMPGFIRYLQSKGIDTSKVKFTENIQDLYRNYTIESKRAKVGKFLKGEQFSTFGDYTPLETAQLELAAEFASVGVPRAMRKGEYNGTWPKRDIQAGESLYSGSAKNRASITPGQSAAALTQAKAAPVAPPSSVAPVVQTGQSRVSTDILQFREFRNKEFGASAQRQATYGSGLYKIREMGIYGRGDYTINPLADDTNYEIEAHKGAGHHENRAFDIPVPNSSRQGDMVAKFWRDRGYRVLWRVKDHYDHVHVEVPADKAAEFFRIIDEPSAPSPPSAVAPRVSLEPSYQRVVAYVPFGQEGGGVNLLSSGSSSPTSAGPSRRTLVNTTAQAHHNGQLYSV